MIECNMCMEWYHRKCVNLSIVEFQRFEKFPGDDYVCPSCMLQCELVPTINNSDNNNSISSKRINDSNNNTSNISNTHLNDDSNGGSGIDNTNSSKGDISVFNSNGINNNRQNNNSVNNQHSVGHDNGSNNNNFNSPHNNNINNNNNNPINGQSNIIPNHISGINDPIGPPQHNQDDNQQQKQVDDIRKDDVHIPPG